MDTEKLLSDPVFQLNLLIWMAREQPSVGYRVKPIFHELGFKIAYIEQPFRFPPDMFNALKRSSLNVSLKPEPDVIMIRSRDGKGLYFEAKAQSFSPASNESRQARGHLAACGPAFVEVY